MKIYSIVNKETIEHLLPHQPPLREGVWPQLPAIIRARSGFMPGGTAVGRIEGVCPPNVACGAAAPHVFAGAPGVGVHPGVPAAPVAGVVAAE